MAHWTGFSITEAGMLRLAQHLRLCADRACADGDEQAEQRYRAEAFRCERDAWLYKGVSHHGRDGNRVDTLSASSDRPDDPGVHV